MGLTLVSSSRQEAHTSLSRLRSGGASGSPQTTPLMDIDISQPEMDTREDRENPTVINTRLNELATSRYLCSTFN